jgi:glycosyltransferase involved in cell wall biosynthesis
MTFNRAKLVMPVSSVLQKSIQERQIRACFQVLPNVVDTNLFFAEARTHNLHLAKRLLTIGPMDRSEKKGLPYLLQALQGLQQQRTDWHLDIIGDGDLRARYEQMTIELGIRQQVTFWGKQPKTEVAALMRQAQILIVPSLFETFSVVAAEALACGVPVLATRCGGPEEFVTDDVGVLVPPGDAAALQSGLQSMLAHLHRYDPATISQQARARFSHASVGAQIHEVYRSVLN